jgi:hypothetical protein
MSESSHPPLKQSEERVVTRKRPRWVFALLGMAACLSACLLVEAMYAGVRVHRHMKQPGTPSMLFAKRPQPPPPPQEPAAPTPQSPVQVPAEPAPNIQERVLREGGKTGRVQVSLAWNGLNDVDLSVVTPTGERIDANNRRDSRGGTMDVDMNYTPLNFEGERRFRAGQIVGAENVEPYLENNPSYGGGFSRKPVENIYWSEDQAPEGTYQVFVHHFWNRERLAAVPYWVEVRIGDQVQQYAGVLSRRNFIEDQEKEQLVCTFTVAPTQQQAPNAQTTTAPQVAPVAAAPVRPQPQAPARPSDLLYTLLLAMVWGGMIGLLLPTLLYLSINQFLEKPLFPRQEGGELAAKGLLLGVTLATGAQILFVTLSSIFPAWHIGIARLIVFSAMGGLFGYGLSRFVPHMARWSTPAGAAGGLLAGLLFWLVTAFAWDMWARLVAALALGAAIGICICLTKQIIERIERAVVIVGALPTLKAAPLRSLPVNGVLRDSGSSSRAQTANAPDETRKRRTRRQPVNRDPV